MNYLVFMILYLVSFVILTIHFFKTNKIDISDYENRKDEVKKEVQRVFKDCFIAMLIFNIFAALAYKLQSSYFWSLNSILAAIFFSLLQTSYITFFYPKTNKLKICRREKGTIVILTVVYMFFILFYAFAL